MSSLIMCIPIVEGDDSPNLLSSQSATEQKAVQEYLGGTVQFWCSESTAAKFFDGPFLTSKKNHLSRDKLNSQRTQQDNFSHNETHKLYHNIYLLEIVSEEKEIIL